MNHDDPARNAANDQWAVTGAVAPLAGSAAVGAIHHDGRQQVRHEQFIQPGRFVTQIYQFGIAQRVVAVGQEKVRRIVPIIVIHGAGRLARGDIEHAGVLIHRSQIDTAHRPVLIEQKLRAIDAAVVVQFLRFFQITNGVVDSVILLVQQGRIKPGRWILGIEVFRQLKLFGGLRIVPIFSISFAQITSQDRALGFERGGQQQVFARGRRKAEREA